MSDTTLTPDLLSTWADAALAPWRLALQTTQAMTPPWLQASAAFTQPINPGWTFGNLIQVTEANSTAPDTEQAIVRRHSYGRQIGRMMDAVELLLEHAPAAVQKDKRAAELKKIQRDVEAIKHEQAARRLQRLRDELAELKRADGKAWAALRAEVDALRAG
jgi:hypothetical protein